MPISDYGGSEVLVSAICIYIKLLFFSNTPFFTYDFRFSLPPIRLAASAFLGLALPGEKGSWQTESKVSKN